MLRNARIAGGSLVLAVAGVRAAAGADVRGTVGSGEAVPRGGVEIWDSPAQVVEHGADLAGFFSARDPAGAEPGRGAGQPADAPKKDQPAPTPSNAEFSFFSGWKGSVEFGLTGSTGNSENLNVRAGISGTRKARETDTAAALTYLYANDEGTKTKNRGELNLRNDWNLGESRWSLFSQGRVEYDEFQDWRWRLSAYGGAGYSFLRDEKTTLKGRLGAGVSKEFLSSRNELVPEGLVGLDFAHQLTERQRIFYSGEYLPSLSEFPQYRVSQKAGWEILVDPEVTMTLKLGVEHRYQSTPGDGFKHSDLDYYALLAWAF